MDAVEFEACELKYLMDDLQRNVTILNEMERYALAGSAAIYSFALVNLTTDPTKGPGFSFLLMFLPSLISWLAHIRLKGVIQRIYHVDKRIYEIEKYAGVNGWWSSEFSKVNNTMSLWVVSRRKFWNYLILGNFGLWFFFSSMLFVSVDEFKKIVNVVFEVIAT